MLGVNQKGDPYNKLYRCEDFNKLSDETQLKVIQHFGGNIRCVENPSEKVQLSAVEQHCGYAIRHIKNPSEKVQLAAVKQDKDAIEHIKNPTIKVQWAVYGYVSLKSEDLRKLDFLLNNTEITVETKNGELIVTNKTNEFLKVLSFAEYIGENVFNISPFNIPPQGFRRVAPINDKNGIKITSLNDKILFGYAVEYKIGNGKSKSLFKTQVYPVSKLLK